MLKLDAFFPPLRILAEHTLQIAMALSSSATAKKFQTGEDMFTDDDVMSATQAESHCSLKLQFISAVKVNALTQIHFNGTNFFNARLMQRVFSV